METLDRLCALLPEADAREIARMGDALCEVRLRAGRPIQLRGVGGGERLGSAIDPEQLRALAAALADHSLYAREAELRQGYFTMPDGCRVGVCGQSSEDAGVTAIGSLCVRVCRAAPGCAEALLPEVIDPDTGEVRATLILSSPGMGKTTCLRELARRLSENGMCVAVADERRELAACRDGVPTLDVGPRTDVMDGCPKHLAVMRLLRAMAPEVIVTDEIGAPGDAFALAEAARCGVAVVASAHAACLEAALQRPGLGGILRSGAFSRIVELGGHPGRIRKVRRWPEDGG